MVASQVIDLPPQFVRSVQVAAGKSDGKGEFKLLELMFAHGVATLKGRF